MQERTEHVCPTCGRTFVAVRRAKFCSVRCRFRSFLDRHPDHNADRRASYVWVAHSPIRCGCCGKVFVPKRSNQRYCSAKCKVRTANVKANAKRMYGGNARVVIGSFGLPMKRCGLCGCSFSPWKPRQTRCRACQNTYRAVHVGHLSDDFA